MLAIQLQRYPRTSAGLACFFYHAANWAKVPARNCRYLKVGELNEIARGRQGRDDLTASGYLCGCVISLFVHEAGHICAARATGVAVKRIGITWRGPYIVRETGSPVTNAIVSAAGPLVNLILAAIIWQNWPTAALVNLVLGLGNLIPTPTSDGLRVLRGISLLWNPDARGIRASASTLTTTLPAPVSRMQSARMQSERLMEQRAFSAE